MPTLDDWLASTREEAIDPRLPICDPHHHLWERPGNRYLTEDLLRDLDCGHRIVSTVFVECAHAYRSWGPERLRPVGETEALERAAEAHAASGHPTRMAAGIVGHANLLLGASVDAVLEAHLAASSERFRGIRHSVAWEASDAVSNARAASRRDLMAVPTFRAGLARLAAHGLSFEAWLYHPQIPDLAALAAAVPETPIVLNHIGAPLGVGPYAGKADEVFAHWKRSIEDLARCENVVVKLGGLGMPNYGMGWHEAAAPPSSETIAAAARPFFLCCVEHFGVGRCMFESNFPVDRVSYSYGVMWNAFKRLSADFSAAERAALFHDTAARFYRLG